MNVPGCRTVAALLIILLAGCGSTPPSSYYLLTADAPGTASGDDISLGVGPVTIPDYLKGRGMVLGRQDHLLQVSEFDRWAEPLEAGITRVLLLNLATLLDTREVSFFPWRADNIPEYAVRVSVVQFAAGEREAILEATWLVLRPASGEILQQSLSRHSRPSTSSDPEAVADLYSALLLELSEEIAAVIAAHREAQEG